MTHPLGAQSGYRRVPLSAAEKARGEANFAPFVAQMLVARGRFRVSADTPDQVELFQQVARRVSDMLQRPVVSYANGREIVITFGPEEAPALALQCGARENGHGVDVVLNPSGQYADDRNLRARQRLWEYQTPFFDIAGWVLSLAGLSPGLRVLDAGCGNGEYLRALAGQPVRAAGCDLSMGMLRSAGHRALLNADITALPLRDATFDVVLAVHMLYHVPDRHAAVRELRRVLAPGGVCIAVTNGGRHLRSLRSLVERSVSTAAPGWQMRPATHAFAAENAAAQLGAAFASVTCVRPAREAPVVIRDATVAADYVASWASFYQDQVARPWPEVVQDVRQGVQAVIDQEGAFVVSGDLAAFVCR